jgi:hypothetical protein
VTVTCDHFDAEVDELAVGAIAEPRRSELLAHAAECEACDARMHELADVADRMLWVAPTAEPPLGFETRVLERLGVRRRRWLRLAAVAASAVALVSGGLVLGGAMDDGDTGAPLVAEGALIAASGDRVGTAQLVETPAPHVLVSIDHPRPGPHTRSCELEDADGRRITVGSWSYDDVEDGVWAVGIDASLLDAVTMRVLAADGSVIATAALEPA